MIESLTYHDLWNGPTIPIHAVPAHAARQENRAGLLKTLSARAGNWCQANGFPGRQPYIIIPDEAGNIAEVLVESRAEEPFFAGRLSKLPPGKYHFASGFNDAELGALAFALDGYRLPHLACLSQAERPILVLEEERIFSAIRPVILGMHLARDLINRPANDLSPRQLAEIAVELFKRHDGGGAIISDDMLEEEFPLVSAVGAASARPPCVAECHWGDEADPLICLVGKGIVFDTGGLNVKPGQSMELMRKDMGGAACVLGLAEMIMRANLPLRLHCVIPCAENSVSGQAFRPGDVIRAADGTAVEIGHTDAEGRLVLADALIRAVTSKPELLIDFATLTGAARVALGPDLPPIFSDNPQLVSDILFCGEKFHDPLWQLPLYRPYERYLETPFADINNVNVTGQSYAGAITAALFLKRFTAGHPAWAHIDLFGWNPAALPGRPKGGEAQSIRAVYAMIKEKYAGRASADLNS